MDLHLHPTLARDQPHLALEHQLVQMMVTYRAPGVPPFDALPLVHAYDACVGLQQQLPVGQANCAMEFLSSTYGDGVLGHLLLAPGYLVAYQQQGVCAGYRAPYQQVVRPKVTQ